MVVEGMVGYGHVVTPNAPNTTGTMEFSRENADKGADDYTLDICFLMGKYTFV